jgi:mannose-6-phosphate isomerase-like protein (cupin superfamily)
MRSEKERQRLRRIVLEVCREVLKGPPAADRRPWGYFVVLSDEKDHKVKRIVVSPGKRLSLQRHRRRAEHWHVVRGEGLVTRDSERIPVREGASLDIPAGAVHRVQNLGASPLVIIEVQKGDYFGEDDIERIEDDFGRV